MPRTATAPHCASAGRSPERTRLAEAIMNRSAAAANLERVIAAAGRAEKLMLNASRALEKAKEQLKDARDGEGKALAEQLLSGDVTLEASPARKAEHAAAEAKKRRERAAEAYELVKAEFEPAQREFESTKRQVKDAAAAVVAAEAPTAELLARAQALQDELINMRLKLRFLHRNGMLGELEKPVGTYLRDIFWVPATVGQVEHTYFDQHPTEIALHEAFAALTYEPDAPALVLSEADGRP